MIYELPVRCDLPAYVFDIQLEGVTYGLGFSWSERQGFWTMDVMDKARTPIVMGVRLFSNVDLLQRFTNPALPPGVFVCYDTAGYDDPGRDTFGVSVKLMYAESL